MVPGNTPPTENTGIPPPPSEASILQERVGPAQGPAGNPMLRLFRWIASNTFAPDRLPAWARVPVVSYLGAMVLFGIGLGLDRLLSWIPPNFSEANEVLLLAVLLIALIWGMGPALLSAVLGTFTTDYFFHIPHHIILVNTAEVVEDAILLIAGLLIAVVASLHESARRQAEILKRQAEAAREESQRLAASLKAQRAEMESFLAVTSHELKTPLTSLKLSLQLTRKRLLSKRSPNPGLASALDDLISHLAHTENDVERLNHLVNDLLDVSRIQEGMLKLRLEETDLAAAVSEAVEEQRRMAPARAIQLSLSAARPEPARLDAVRIKQVVSNYLSNALKYSPADCPVEMGLEVNGGQARVWVRDQGPGILPEEQQRIWQRFYRVKGIEVQSGAGIGLGVGLYICRQIIEAHHGQVGVESAPGGGSIFWFTMPLTRAESSAEAVLS
jgi:signal transduction histidine kinase